MSKKKIYTMGRKQKQFYITYNNKNYEYEIKPIPDNKTIEEISKLLIDEYYIYSGSYAECYAFKKGYFIGYNTFKQYYKNNVNKVLKDISKAIFDHDVEMKEIELPKENDYENTKN